MNKLITLALGGLFAAGISSAANVDYATTAVFNCNLIVNCSGTGTNIATFVVGVNETLTITFNGNTDSVNTPSNTNYGNITMACANCVDSAFTLTGLTLALSLTQGPDPFAQGSTTLTTGTFTGFVIVTGNTQSGLPTVNFAPTFPALVLGPGGPLNTTVTYTVDSPVRPSVTNAVNITGTVDAVDNPPVGGVPEPGTIGLIGLGLVGLGAIARRKK